jgi:hypothetical protein
VALQPQTRVEIAVLPVLIQVRLSISVMVGACAISKDPGNEYLKLHALPAREAIVFKCQQLNEVHSTYFQSVQDLFGAKADGSTSGGKIVNEKVCAELISKYYK